MAFNVILLYGCRPRASFALSVGIRDTKENREKKWPRPRNTGGERRPKHISRASVSRGSPIPLLKTLSRKSNWPF